MAKYARYTVIVERELGESDGSGVYHDGTGKAAVEQLNKELQEAWNSGSVAGFFRVTERHILDLESATGLGELPTDYEDEPNLEPPTPVVAGGLALDAIMVCLLDENVRSFLEINDPMAFRQLEQAQHALRLAGIKSSGDRPEEVRN